MRLTLLTAVIILHLGSKVLSKRLYRHVDKDRDNAAAATTDYVTLRGVVGYVGSAGRRTTPSDALGRVLNPAIAHLRQHSVLLFTAL